MEQDLFVWLNWKRWFFSLSPNNSLNATPALPKRWGLNHKTYVKRPLALCPDCLPGLPRSKNWTPRRLASR
jgi:hypothetical protein